MTKAARERIFTRTGGQGQGEWRTKRVAPVFLPAYKARSPLKKDMEQIANVCAGKKIRI